MMLSCLVFCRRVYLGALDSGWWWIHEYVKRGDNCMIETFAPFLSFSNYFYPLSLEGFGVGAVIAPKNSSFNLCKFLKSFIACNESRVAGLVLIGNFCKFSSGSKLVYILKH